MYLSDRLPNPSYDSQCSFASIKKQNQTYIPNDLKLPNISASKQMGSSESKKSLSPPKQEQPK